MAAYLAPADYVDSDHPLIIARARQLCAGAGTGAGAGAGTGAGAGGGAGTGAGASTSTSASALSEAEAARAVFYFVRDLRYRSGDFEDLEIDRKSVV